MKTLAIVAVFLLASCASVQPEVLGLSISPRRPGQKTFPIPVKWTLGPDKQATAEVLVWLLERDRGSQYVGSAVRAGETVQLCYRTLEPRPAPRDVMEAEAYHANMLFRLDGVAAIPKTTRVGQCVSANNSFKPSPLRGLGRAP